MMKYNFTYSYEDNLVPLGLIIDDNINLKNDVLEYKTDKPLYIFTDDKHFSLVPNECNLSLESDCFYEIKFQELDLDRSIIFYIFFYDEKTRIDTFEVVLEKNAKHFIFRTPKNYKKSKISFRITEEGYFSFKKMELKKVEIEQSNFNEFFENCIETNNKKLIHHYYSLLKNLEDYTFLSDKNLIDFIKNYINDENEQDIFKLLDYLKKKNRYEKLLLNKDLKQKLISFEIKNLNDALGDIRVLLSEKGIKNYFVYFITSGFGDILTNANMQAYICETLGLQFSGINNIENINTRPYYQDLMKKITLKNNSGKVYYIEVNNFIEDYKSVINAFKNLKTFHFDTICLVPKHPSGFSSLRLSDDFNENLFNNQFNKYFQSLLNKSKLFDIKYENTTTLTLHIRLGDVAPIKIEDYIVIPYEINRKNYEHGLYNIKTEKGSKDVFKKYQELKNIKFFLDSIKKNIPNIKINFVSDGFDLTKTRVDNDTFRDNLLSCNINYDKNEIFNYLDKEANCLNSLSFDKKVIGERSVEQFIETIRIVLGSDIVISNARSFIYNILMSFKTDNKFLQKFYSPIRGYYFEAVSKKNVVLETYKDFNSIVDDLKYKVLNQDNELINYSPYAFYYTSSISEWEKHKKGSLLDKSSDTNRFSFHTQKEDNPFVVINFKEQILIESLEIIYRDKYSENILPLSLKISLDGCRWKEITVIDTINKNLNKLLLNEFNRYGKLKYIKIEKIGFGELFLSAINIFISKEQFFNIQSFKSISENKTILVYSPFYGLGGRLETLASAFGFLQKSDFKNIVIDWGENKAEKQIKYPFQIDYEKDKDVVKRNLAFNISSFILNENKKLKFETNISHFRAPQSLDCNNEVVFISRDSLGEFINKGEHLYSTMQRLYSNIIPSDEVIEYLVKIENKFELETKYCNAIGIHVRHGNGERYYNHNTKTWGVKPPNKAEIIKPIKKMIKTLRNEVNNLIVASDCIAIKEILEDEFKNKLNIIFISEYIQPLGSGCNHLEYTFSKKVKRNIVEHKLDELITFAEILCLSKCIGLLGGKSFFFNSIIGFSNCSVNNIDRINNQDRYIILDDDLVPIEEVNTDLSNNIVDLLTNNYIKTDGIFFRSSKNKIYLSYFDIKLFNGDLKKINDSLESIKKVLLINRMY